MVDCIFCRIIAGKIPCDRVYEDANTMAFLDIKPASLGHTLVIPKMHAETLDKLSEKDLKSLITTVQRISKAISRISEGYNVIQNNKEVAGQIVHHAHFHIVPRKTEDGIHWNRPYPNFSEKQLKEVTNKIKRNLTS